MSNLKSHFYLKDDITYLNFGSFGACPRPVLEKYQQFQIEMEEEPVQFITVNGLRYLATSRQALGEYINCNKDDVVYVTNPSYAVNAVAKSFTLKPGDEVLSTNLEYGACDRVWDYYCLKAGATYVRQPISLPIQNKETFIDDFKKGINGKTKLIFISHITSCTALRFPVEEVIKLAKENGIPVFIDGAHVPGHIPLDITALDPEFYTGACHKWMMTAKGSSFLYVRKDWQDNIDPLIVSWGYKALFPSASQFLDYHQMNGTRDYTAFLTIPASIEFMKKYNWSKVAEDCREMVKANAFIFTELLNTYPHAPMEDDFFGQMCSAVIKCDEPEKLHDLFLEKYKIQIPVMRQDSQTFLRFSLNGFNSQHDLDILYDAIRNIKKTTGLIE